MIRRLLKEFAPLAWPFFFAIIIVQLSVILTDETLYVFWFVLGGQIILCYLMGTASFGSEFENNTLERLLSQPVPRIALWREKMGVLAGSVGVIFLLSMAVFYLYANPAILDFFHRARFNGLAVLLNFFIPAACAYLSSLCAGTLMALYLKKTHTAFWASLTSTALILVIWQFLLSICLSILGMKMLLYGEKAQEYGIAIQAGLPLFLWCIVSYSLARRKFMRMEV